MDGWDVCGCWFGVVVVATPRLGELRRGEMIPWHVIAAQIAPRERRRSRWSDGARLDWRSVSPLPSGTIVSFGGSAASSRFRRRREMVKEIIGRGLGV